MPNHDFLKLALADGIPRENVRKPQGNEAYRVIVPGLDTSITVPVYEADRASNQPDFQYNQAVNELWNK